MAEPNPAQELANLATQAFQQIEALSKRLLAVEEHQKELERRINGLAVGVCNGLAAAQQKIVESYPYVELKEKKYE